MYMMHVCPQEPPSAFISLANLVNRKLFRTFITMDLEDIRFRFGLFDAIFEKNIPILFHRSLSLTLSHLSLSLSLSMCVCVCVYMCNYSPICLSTCLCVRPDVVYRFTKVGVLNDLYLMEWTITLFSKQLSISLASRVWDGYFLHGIYRATPRIITPIGAIRAIYIYTLPMMKVMYRYL